MNDGIDEGNAVRVGQEAKRKNGSVAEIDDVVLDDGAHLSSAFEVPPEVLDFFAYMPEHRYIFTPSRELWPASSVNATCPPVIGPDAKPIRPTAWLDRFRAIQQMSWSPGQPMVVSDKLISHGGWIEKPGSATFNLYREPVIQLGQAGQAGRWLEHVRLLYGGDADHIVRWLAHRVQRPEIKVNHAIVLGGCQGIGKDTLLEPVKHAVGPWNFAEVSPHHLLGRFNGFLKSVILRVSEARDLGDVDRYTFYDHMKTFTAAPPDVLRCDEKNIREYSVLNVCGVVLTTNHKDGIFLPPDDRRHFVAWSNLVKEDFDATYWTSLYGWFAAGGIGHVAAYLRELDLSAFDPKAPPPKTRAFLEIVDLGRAPEDAELADVLDALSNPPAITLGELSAAADASLREWLQDRRSRRQIPHRLETAGFTPVRNSAANDGLWKVRSAQGKRQVIYARHDLPERERLRLAGEKAAGSLTQRCDQ